MTLRPGLASLCHLILPQGRTLWANEVAWWGFPSTRSHGDYSAQSSLFPVPISKMAAAPLPGLYPSPKWPPRPAHSLPSGTAQHAPAAPPSRTPPRSQAARSVAAISRHCEKWRWGPPRRSCRGSAAPRRSSPRQRLPEARGSRRPARGRARTSPRGAAGFRARSAHGEAPHGPRWPRLSAPCPVEKTG